MNTASFTLRRVSVPQNKRDRVEYTKKPANKQNIQATIYFKNINSKTYIRQQRYISSVPHRRSRGLFGVTSGRSHKSNVC